MGRHVFWWHIHETFPSLKMADTTSWLGLFILIWIVIPMLLWKYAYTSMKPYKIFNSKSVLLIIAHPDDETMFFSPTIQSLSKQGDVSILCLSQGYHGLQGNSEGLGKIRREELEKSCKKLGIKKCEIIDDTFYLLN